MTTSTSQQRHAQRITPASVSRNPKQPCSADVQIPRYNTRQTSRQRRCLHSSRPKPSVSSVSLSCNDTVFSGEQRRDDGYLPASETVSSSHSDRSQCSENHGQDVCASDENCYQAPQETQTPTQNPLQLHDHHHDVDMKGVYATVIPAQLDKHQEQSQSSTPSPSSCRTPTKAQDVDWEAVSAFEAFKKDPAHDYWKWDRKTQKWCHIDEKGLVISCPTTLD
ncbi:hypothetical protein BDP67DRAFT_504395 [Colletotrichum lupini]|nr:hypothetical protein BDP67DRAFT_504395 [Colletotrichum lupini]